MSDLSAPKIIVVAKDLRVLSRILLVLALIAFVLNVVSFFSGNSLSLAMFIVTLQMIVCMKGESASDSYGYVYTSLRNGAIGCALIVAYYIIMTIIWIISMTEIYATFRLDSFVLSLAWIVGLECIAGLGAYSALLGLFIKHALRAKEQLELGPECDLLNC